MKGCIVYVKYYHLFHVSICPKFTNIPFNFRESFLVTTVNFYTEKLDTMPNTDLPISHIYTLYRN